MRFVVAAILAALVLPAAAQSAPRSRPPGTVPLEEPLPPPPMVEPDPTLEPQVSVRTEGDNDIQEYRVKGKLYMVRVTPKHGRAYVLMDHQGNGTFMRQDNPLDTGVRVPQWVLMEF